MKKTTLKSVWTRSSDRGTLSWSQMNENHHSTTPSCYSHSVLSFSPVSKTIHTSHWQVASLSLASQDTFRHVPVCCTLCILAACTLLVPSSLPARQLHGHQGIGTSLSLARKTRYSSWFLLTSSGFYVLCGDEV